MSQDNDFAIIIGINKYARLRDLRGPVNDALCFREWLISPDGGDVPPHQITTILSGVDEADSCYDQNSPPGSIFPEINCSVVDKAFDTFIEIAAKNGGRVGRRLYVFLAGHGFGPAINDAALLMSNADLDIRLGFHLSGLSYINWFREASYFNEIVLFMDCCRDKNLRCHVRRPPWTSQGDSAAATDSYFFGFATRWSSKARERAFGNDNNIRGVFTEALIRALKLCVPDSNGNINASAVGAFVENEIEKLKDERFFPTPEIEKYKPEFQYRTPGDFVILQRAEAAKTPVKITFLEEHPEWQVRLYSDKLDELDLLDGMVGSWELQLPVGFFTVRAFDAVTGDPGKDFQSFEVTSEGITHVNY